MKKLVIILVVVALLAGVGVGIAYATTTIWSGKAHITIEEPTGAAQCEITDITAENSSWDNATKTWTVSIARAEYATLFVKVKNIGGDAVDLKAYVNGHMGWAYLAPGVKACGSSYLLAAGHTIGLNFTVAADADAAAQTLSDIQLAIRSE